MRRDDESVMPARIGNRAVREVAAGLTARTRRRDAGGEIRLSGVASFGCHCEPKRRPALSVTNLTLSTPQSLFAAKHDVGEQSFLDSGGFSG